MTKRQLLTIVRNKGPNALWMTNAWFLVLLCIWQGTWYLYAAWTPGAQLGKGNVPAIEMYIPGRAGIYTHSGLILVLGLSLLYQLRGDYDKWLRRTLYAYVVFSVFTSALFLLSWWAKGQFTWGLPGWWLLSAMIAGGMIVHHPAYNSHLREIIRSDSRGIRIARAG